MNDLIILLVLAAFIWVLHVKHTQVQNKPKRRVRRRRKAPKLGQRIVHGKRKHTCKVCCESFTTAKGLQAHYAKQHRLKSRIKQSKRSDWLGDHPAGAQKPVLPREVAGAKVHKCYVCGKEFKSYNAMVRHYKTAHGIT